MKHARILGLAAIALAALFAVPGTASATTLTSPSGTLYTGSLVAENEGPIVLTGPFGFGTISCKKSRIEAPVEKHGTNVTVSGNVSLWTLSNCEGGNPSSPIVKRGSLEIHGTSTTGNGTVTSLNLELVVAETILGVCTFTTASTGTTLGTLTGSNITKTNAFIDLSGTIPGSCGSGALEGKYRFLTPGTLEVH